MNRHRIISQLPEYGDVSTSHLKMVADANKVPVSLVRGYAVQLGLTVRSDQRKPPQVVRKPVDPTRMSEAERALRCAASLREKTRAERLELEVLKGDMTVLRLENERLRAENKEALLIAGDLARQVKVLCAIVRRHVPEFQILR